MCSLGLAVGGCDEVFFETPEARELGEESFRKMQSISKEDYVRSQQRPRNASSTYTRSFTDQP